MHVALRAVKRDADDAVFALVSDEPVVGDIGEIREDGIVRIAFDRPEVRNAFRPHTVDETFQGHVKREKNDGDKSA